MRNNFCLDWSKRNNECFDSCCIRCWEWVSASTESYGEYSLVLTDKQCLMNWKIALNYYYCRWNEFDSQRHDCETNKKMVFEFSNCKWHLAWTVKSIAVVLVSICEAVSVKCLACLLQIAFNIISRTMLSGWYCRSMANQNSTDHNEQDDDNEPNVVDESDDSQDIPVARLMPRIDYKAQYTTLKKKLKFLLYVSTSFSLWLNAVCTKWKNIYSNCRVLQENEFFQDALRSSQRRLLKVTRDRSFLLDRLLQYEKPENSSSESDDTESSEDDVRTENTKKWVKSIHLYLKRMTSEIKNVLVQAKSWFDECFAW